MNRLQDKVAVVYGAGPNIGGTTAYFLAREGAKVVVVDISLAAAQKTVDFIKSRGCEAIAFEGDATTEAVVAAATQKAVSHYGGLDIIFNMAGIVLWKSVLEMDTAEWTRALASFPTAGMLTTKYAAKAMLEGGRRGSIIHLLSTAAHFGEAEGAAYTSSKAALMSFARSAAMDLARYGIRVNTITPCSVEHQLWTKMKQEVDEEKFEFKPGRPLYSRDDYLKNIPLGRFPRASDLAHAAVFLASDEARMLTGVDIPVDGGLRFKYPTWRPGDQTGLNIGDYVRSIRRTEYGEEKEKLFD
jgi:NAD(P)-dependent dehydrogenase (short-subunit alcohol dehydrogenase family)